MQKVAIGIGSNLGDRQGNLDRAVQELSAHLSDLQLSSTIETLALLKPGSPKEWNIPFLNAVVVGKTAFSAQELLDVLQQIERQMGREKLGDWSPRLIDLDILLYGQEVIELSELVIPHPEMLKREFVMQPLSEVAGDWVHPVEKETISSLVKKKRVRIVGIVNVTPDSFSDGGQAFAPKAAITHAEQLLGEGADILDIGAESTRPKAKLVSPEEEWNRLQPVLEVLVGKAVISVDTRHGETAKKALRLGAHWINDVSAASSPELPEAVAGYPKAKYVLMHSLSIPADPSVTVADDLDVVEEVLTFAREKIVWLQEQGLSHEQIIFDPGIGFGKTSQQSLELIERIAEFNVLGVPLFVGHSRKSFLALFTDAPAQERDQLTLKFSHTLAANGVRYLRVHNVALHQELRHGV